MPILFRKSIREFWQKKFSYFFLIIILAIGFGTYTAINNFMFSREQVFNELYEQSQFFDIQLELQFEQTLSSEQWQQLLAETQTRSSQPIAFDEAAQEYRLSYDMQVRLEDDTVIQGRIIGYDVSESKGFGELEVNRPLFYVDDPAEIAGEEDKIYLERNFATFYELEPGDEIEIILTGQERQFEIAEYTNIPQFFAVTREGDLATAHASYAIVAMDSTTATDILGEDEEKFNELVMRIDNLDEIDVEQLRAELESTFAEQGIPLTTTLEEENTARAQILNDLEQDREVFAIFPILFISVAALSLAVVLQRIIDRQKNEIGLYKAMGVRTLTIVWSYLQLALIIAFASVAIGMFFNFVLLAGFNQILVAIYDFAISGNYSQASTIWEAIVITFAITIFSVLIPVVFAIRGNLIDALQKREGIGNSGLNIFVKLTSRLPLPQASKISLQYFFRNLGRGLTTIIGISLSMMIFVTIYLIIASVLSTIQELKDLETWNYEVRLASFATEDQLEQIALPEDEFQVTSALNLPLTFERSESDEDQDDEELSALLYGIDLEGNIEEFDLNIKSGEVSEAKYEGIIISTYMQSELDVEVGDEVNVKIPEFNLTTGTVNLEQHTTEVIAVHDAPIGFYTFIDDNYLQEIANLPDLYNTIYLTSTEEKTLSVDERNDIIADPAVESLTSTEQKDNQVDSFVASFSQIIYLILFISAILAFTIVYNMFSLNVQERIRDYATMRTLGTSNARIGSLLASEFTFVTVISIALGGLMAWFLSQNLISGVSEAFAGLEFRHVFAGEGFVYGAIMLVIPVIAVFWLSIRTIASLNLADMIRSRSG
jgi:putative ABC transport system permease protein